MSLDALPAHPAWFSIFSAVLMRRLHRVLTVKASDRITNTKREKWKEIPKKNKKKNGKDKSCLIIWRRRHASLRPQKACTTAVVSFGFLASSMRITVVPKVVICIFFWLRLRDANLSVDDWSGKESDRLLTSGEIAFSPIQIVIYINKRNLPFSVYNQ